MVEGRYRFLTQMLGGLIGGLLSSAALATPQIDSAQFCVDDSVTRFVVDVTDSSEEVIFRIAAQGQAFLVPVERFAVNFDPRSGAVTRVEPIVTSSSGLPLDVWADGPVPGTVIESLGGNSWRVSGELIHGADRLQVGDLIPQLAVRNAIGTALQANLPVSACEEIPAEPFARVEVEFDGLTVDGRIDVNEWRPLAFYKTREVVADGLNRGWIDLPGVGYALISRSIYDLNVLVNVTEDTGNDSLRDGGGDNLWLLFDINGDGQITPGVDKRFAMQPGTSNLRSQSFTSASSADQFSNPQLTFATRGEGFDCFVADGSFFKDTSALLGTVCNRHRVYEYTIRLSELSVASSITTLRMGLRIESASPFIDAGFPGDSSKLGAYAELDLAGARVVQPRPAPTAADLRLSISQGVEDTSGQVAVPYIADLPTAARINAVTADSTEPSTSVFLTVSKNGIDVPGSPFYEPTQRSLYPTPGSTNFPDRIHKNGWFVLPDAALGAGRLELGAGFAANGPEPEITRTVILETSRPLEYWIYPVAASVSLVPGSESILAAPTLQEIEESIEDNLKFLPTANLTWRFKSQLTTTTISGPLLNEELNRLYNWNKLFYTASVLQNGFAPYVLPDMLVGFTGFSLCRQRPNNANACTLESGKSFPTWRGDSGRVFWTRPDGNSFAHEINHNADRTAEGTWGRHIPGFSGCGQSGRGVDPLWPYPSTNIEAFGHEVQATRVVSQGAALDDLMAYCSNRWTSPYRWRRLFYDYFALSAQPTPVALTSLTAQRSTLESSNVLASEIVPTLYVSGTVSRDGTGTLNPLLVQPGLPEAPGLDGNHRLLQLDCQGQVLDEQTFGAAYRGVEGGRLDTESFRFMLPSADGLCGVRLEREGQVLSEILQTEATPELVLDSPQPGDQWLGEETVSWTGTDTDNDELTYSVAYSSDGGMSWEVLAAELNTTSLTVDSHALAGSEDARIRVVATDGFNSATVESAAGFSVPEKPPTVLITLPEDIGQVLGADASTIRGQAFETDGELITGDALQWFVDGELAGYGERLPVGLPNRDYEIRLDAISTTGLVGSSTRTLRVRDANQRLDSIGDVMHESVDIAELAVIADTDQLSCELTIASGEVGIAPGNKYVCEFDFNNLEEEFLRECDANGDRARDDSYVLGSNGRCSVRDTAIRTRVRNDGSVRCRGPLAAGATCEQTEINTAGAEDGVCDGLVSGGAATACRITMTVPISSLLEARASACGDGSCSGTDTNSINVYAKAVTAKGEPEEVSRERDRAPDTGDGRRPNTLSEVLAVPLP